MALTRIDSDMIVEGAIDENKIANTVALGGPKISTVQVTDSSYNVLDDTAVDLSGGYIKITGTGFAAGCQVMINNTPATVTTFVSSTEVCAQVPAQSAGTNVVYVVNSDGGVAIKINGITYSSTPTWVTGSTLTGTQAGQSISIQLAATGASTYALAAGSSLPDGLTLSSGGLLSGTVTGIAVETTYSFTIRATDAENQDSPRTFSITISVTPPDTYWSSVKFLYRGNGTQGSTTFVEDKNVGFSLTANSATIDTSTKKFGSGSIYIPNTSSPFVVSSATSYFGSDYNYITIDFWMYITGGEGWAFKIGSEGIYLYGSNSGYFYYGGTSAQWGGGYSRNNWVHVAINRSRNAWASSGSGGGLEVYFNGGRLFELPNYNLNAGTQFRFFDGLTGYIDDVRMTYGVNRYNGNYSVPTTEAANY